ncbi:hypothetical protein PPACK8108_LOCUS615, partial [Phakopsora pachyrhizi]
MPLVNTTLLQRESKIKVNNYNQQDPDLTKKRISGSIKPTIQSIWPNLTDVLNRQTRFSGAWKAKTFWFESRIFTTQTCLTPYRYCCRKFKYFNTSSTSEFRRELMRKKISDQAKLEGKPLWSFESETTIDSINSKGMMGQSNKNHLISESKERYYGLWSFGEFEEVEELEPSTWERFSSKFKEQLLVPIGAGATTIALLGAGRAIQQGNSSQFNL